VRARARWRGRRGLAAASAFTSLTAFTTLASFTTFTTLAVAAIPTVAPVPAVAIPVASPAVSPAAVAAVTVSAASSTASAAAVTSAVALASLLGRLTPLHRLSQALWRAEVRRRGGHLVVLAVSAPAVQVVLLAVVVRLRLDLDGLVVAVHQVPQLLPLLVLEQPRHLGVAVHHQRRILEVRRLAPDFPEDLVGHGG